MAKPHKYDPLQHSVILFDHRNRRHGMLLTKNYQRAANVAARWKRRTGGADATVMRCLLNTALGRPTMPTEWQ